MPDCWAQAVPEHNGDMEPAAAAATRLWVVPGGNHAYPHGLFIQGARAQRTSLHRSVLMLKDSARQTGLPSDPESPPLGAQPSCGQQGPQEEKSLVSLLLTIQNFYPLV